MKNDESNTKNTPITTENIEITGPIGGTKINPAAAKNINTAITKLIAEQIDANICSIKEFLRRFSNPLAIETMDITNIISKLIPITKYEIIKAVVKE